jgi:hypothetical protein
VFIPSAAPHVDDLFAAMVNADRSASAALFGDDVFEAACDAPEVWVCVSFEHDEFLLAFMPVMTRA